MRNRKQAVVFRSHSGIKVFGVVFVLALLSGIVIGNDLENICEPRWEGWRWERRPTLVLTVDEQGPFCCCKELAVTANLETTVGVAINRDLNDCEPTRRKTVTLNPSVTWTASGCDPSPSSGTGLTAIFTPQQPGSCTITFTAEAETTHPDDSFLEYASVEVSIVKVALEAEDTTTHGANNIRKVSAGQILYMVRDEGFQTQTAMITASEIGNHSFVSDEPFWEGQTAGHNGNVTVYFTGGAGDSATIAAAAWDCSKEVGINVVGKNEAAFTLFPGANALADALDSLNRKTAFPGGSLEVSIDNPSLSGSRWTVEKPNSGDTTHSYRGSVKVGGSLTGKIVHPTFSGEFPPDWLPGDPWALWEVFMEATIGLALEANAECLNEYSPAQISFDGSGILSGEVKAGVYAVAQVAGYTGEGAAYASAGIAYNFNLEGAPPDRKLMGQWQVLPVSLNAELKLVRDSDEWIAAHKSISYNIWDGWVQSPKTVLLSEPGNPAD